MIDRLRDLGEMLSLKKTDATILLGEEDLDNTKVIIRAMVNKHLELNPHLIEAVYQPVLLSFEEEGQLGDVSPFFVGSWCVFPGEGEYDKEFKIIFELKAQDLGIPCPPAFGRNDREMRKLEPQIRGIINEEIRNCIQEESGDVVSLEKLIEDQSADNASFAG